MYCWEGEESRSVVTLYNLMYMYDPLIMLWSVSVSGITHDDATLTLSTSEVETPTPCVVHTDVTYSKEFIIGLVLAISSSAFIGTSFIVKKKGLLRYTW